MIPKSKIKFKYLEPKKSKQESKHPIRWEMVGGIFKMERGLGKRLHQKA